VSGAALGPVLATRTCLYTLTPDREFVLDAVPGHRGAFLALGAGHGFKFASVIGQVLSEVALDGRTPSDLAPFRIDRPLLRMANPPRNYRA
jgi:sarcosine oxidase